MLTLTSLQLLSFVIVTGILFQKYGHFIRGFVRFFLAMYLTLLMARPILYIIFMSLPYNGHNWAGLSQRNKDDAKNLIKECLSIIILLVSSIVFDCTMFKLKKIEIILNRRKLSVEEVE